MITLNDCKKGKIIQNEHTTLNPISKAPITL